MEEDRGEAARRLRSGSRAKRGEAGSSYRAQNKSPWTGLRRKESVGGNQRTKQIIISSNNLARQVTEANGLEKGKQENLLQGCLMKPKGRLQPGSPGTWKYGCGGNQRVTPLSSLSLASLPSVPTTALFLSPNTGCSCISAHKAGEGCLTTLKPYCLLSGSVPGKEILSGSAKARD